MKKLKWIKCPFKKSAISLKNTKPSSKFQKLKCLNPLGTHTGKFKKGKHPRCTLNFYWGELILDFVFF